MNSLGMNLIKDGINIINITPIMIKLKQWYCVGFEPSNCTMGDFFHFLLIRADIQNCLNLLEGLKGALKDTPILLRIHSECLFGDIFCSDLCDCGEQLAYTIEEINARGYGAILYLRQEGRGIGLRAKLACLAVQAGYEKGKWTGIHISSDHANLYYGFKVDQREYSLAAKALRAVGISKVELITGNMEKIKALEEQGIVIVSRKDTPFSYRSRSDRKYNEMLEKLSRGYMYSFKEDLVFEPAPKD